jgi:hypothetical protein
MKNLLKPGTLVALVFALPAMGIPQEVARQAVPARQPLSVLETVDPNSGSGPVGSPIDAGENIDKFLTRLALDSIPHSFTEDKDWGQQDERWDGIKWHRDGMRISTNRRRKIVNHGTWRKYSIELIDPQDEFSVQVKNFHKLDNGKTAFDVHFTAHLKIDARESKWVKGVQLYSFSAEGHAKVRLRVSCELEVSMDLTRFPPDLLFSPVATNADLIVDEFRIDRISKAGGEFAQQMTRVVRKQLDSKIEEKEDKLVEKINRQLNNRQDKMKLSIADAVQSRFAAQAKSFLPDDVQQAIGQSR